jgi:hypothetical protein
MIINRIYEHQTLLTLDLVSFLVGLRTYLHSCRSAYVCKYISFVYTKLSSIKCVEEIAELSVNVYSATGCKVFLPL